MNSRILVPYIFPLNPDYVAARSLRSLRSNDLTQVLQSNSYDSFMSKLTHYAKNVTGINACWNKARDNLKEIIQQKEAPTIFWTLSCADFHWPEFHQLFCHKSTD